MDVTLRLVLNQDHLFKFYYKSYDVLTGISTPIDISAYTASFMPMSSRLNDIPIGVGVSQDSANGIVNVVIGAALVPEFRLNNIKYFQVRLTGPGNLVMASGKVVVVVVQ